MAPISRKVELSSTRFSSLDELASWVQGGINDPLDKLRIPREYLTNYRRTKRKHPDDATHEPQVIVCHDYKGNYVKDEDDSPLGYFPHNDGLHYFLQFPSLVDIFIYFSHNKISVPPVSWTNTLHRQGILSLGTLIFEGTSDQKSLDALVERAEDGHFKYVKALVKLCLHYRFDGWLVNIETQFFHPLKSIELLSFMQSLRSELHLINPNSKLIWYDSLIASRNRVFYQNGVTELNYEHFDSSDHFFTNYWWDEQTLKKNILNVGIQGIQKKLFVGIDIWGRGSRIGDGGFETGLAMKLIKLYSSNIALFAPAWTYENFNRSDFVLNDQQFWVDEIHDENNPSGSVSTYVEHFTSPMYENGHDTVFYTSFSQGDGNGFSVEGQKVYDQKWVNIGLQQSTPSTLSFKKLEIIKDQSYNGGSSLKVVIQKSVENSSKSNSIDLFKFQNDINSRNLNVSISFKCLDEIVKQDLSLTLEISYYIERRFRSVTKVREGIFRVPLSVELDWKILETSFPLPRLDAREHFVLSGVQINWVPKGPNESHEVENFDPGEKSWIFVSGYSDINTKYELLLGDLLIEGIDNTKDIQSVNNIIKEEFTDDQILVTWGDNEWVLHWLIYINAQFVGSSITSNWVTHKRDRIRVDCVSRSGKIIRGDDLFV
jgi:hypothetical protein